MWLVYIASACVCPTVRGGLGAGLLLWSLGQSPLLLEMRWGRCVDAHGRHSHGPY